MYINKVVILWLPAAVIEDTILGMHGGLSPHLQDLDQVKMYTVSTFADYFVN